MLGRNQEVNLSAALLPADANLTVFYWWIGEQLQVRGRGSGVGGRGSGARLRLTHLWSCSRG